jgi:hypothetical protein
MARRPPQTTGCIIRIFGRHEDSVRRLEEGFRAAECPEVDQMYFMDTTEIYERRARAQQDVPGGALPGNPRGRFLLVIECMANDHWLSEWMALVARVMLWCQQNGYLDPTDWTIGTVAYELVGTPHRRN